MKTKLDRIQERIRSFRPGGLTLKECGGNYVDPVGDVRKLLEILDDIVEELQRLDRAVNHK